MMDYDEECQLHAEVDRLRAELARIGADPAEQVIARLRAELSQWKDDHQMLSDRLDAVIALCDDPHLCPNCEDEEEGLLYAFTVRAAATGDTK